MEENKTTLKAVKTTAGDVGVKLLDIIAKPISILCEYAEEPIKIVESMRKINEEDDGKRDLNNEIRREKELAKLNQKNIKAKQEYEKAQMKLKREMAEAEAEIDAFKNEAKLKNQMELLNAVKDYQNELSKSLACMTQTLQNCSVNQLRETSKLLIEVNKQIGELRADEEQRYIKQRQELKEEFGDDKETYKMLLNDLLNDKAVVVNQINEIFRICSEQIEAINKLSNDFTKNGEQTIKELLNPITRDYTYNMLSANSGNALDVSDNGKKVIEAEAVEVE